LIVPVEYSSEVHSDDGKFREGALVHRDLRACR